MMSTYPEEASKVRPIPLVGVQHVGGDNTGDDGDHVAAYMLANIFIWK